MNGNGGLHAKITKVGGMMMKKMFRCVRVYARRLLAWSLAVLMLAGMLPVMRVQAAVDVGILNPGFEEGEVFPRNWTKTPAASDVTWVSTPGKVSEGVKSVRINDTSTEIAGGLYSDTVSPVVAGDEYMLFADCYVESGAVDVMLEFRTAGNVRDIDYSPKTYITGAWHTVSSMGPARATAAGVRVWINSGQTNKATGYFDNIRMIKLEPGDTQLVIDYINEKLAAEKTAAYSDADAAKYLAYGLQSVVGGIHGAVTARGTAYLLELVNRYNVKEGALSTEEIQAGVDKVNDEAAVAQVRAALNSAGTILTPFGTGVIPLPAIDGSTGVVASWSAVSAGGNITVSGGAAAVVGMPGVGEEAETYTLTLRLGKGEAVGTLNYTVTLADVSGQNENAVNAVKQTLTAAGLTREITVAGEIPTPDFDTSTGVTAAWTNVGGSAYLSLEDGKLTADSLPQDEIDESSVTLTLSRGGASVALAYKFLTYEKLLNIPVTNAGFEEIAATGYAADWTTSNVITPPTMDARPSTEAPRSGGYSLKVTDTRSDAATGLRSPGIVVKPGYEYVARAWVKGAGSPNLYLEYRTPADTVAANSIQTIPSVDSQWTQAEARRAAPMGITTNAHVLLYSNSGNTGTYFFDDVEFYEVTRAGILMDIEKLLTGSGTEAALLASLQNGALGLDVDPLNAGQYLTQLRAARSASGGRTLINDKIKEVLDGINLAVDTADSASIDELLEEIGAEPGLTLTRTGIIMPPTLTNPDGVALQWAPAEGESYSRILFIVKDALLQSQPLAGEADESARLTLRLSKGRTVKTIDYAVTIKPYGGEISELVRAAEGVTPADLLGGQTADFVTANLTLPGTAGDGISVSWASSDTSAISAAGVVTRPAYTTSASDAAVTLTATFRKGEASYSRTYSFIVPNLGVADSRILDVHNPGFEEGELASWITVALGFDYGKTRERVFTGDYAIRMDDPNGPDSVSKESEKVYGAREGFTYRVGAMAYTDVSTANPAVYVRFWDNEGMLISSANLTYKSAAPVSEFGLWKNLEVSGVAPVGTAMVSVLLYSGTSSEGVVYFDDVRLREYPIIRNGGFQLGGATWVLSGGASVTGGTEKTLQINGAGTARSARSASAPGVLYYLAADYVLESGAGELILEFVNKDGGNTGTRSVSLAAGGERAAAVYGYAPAGTTSVDAKLSVTGGKATFDHVQVVRAPYGTAVSDGGFERTHAGAGTPWTLTGAAVSGEDKAAGKAALRLQAGGKAVSNRIPVLEGKQYTAMASARGGVAMKLNFLNNSNSIVGSAEGAYSANGWGTVSATGTAPRGTAYAEIVLTSQGGGYADDVDIVSLSTSVSNMSMENQNINYAGTFPFNWKPFGPVAAYSSGQPDQYTLGIKGLAVEAFGLGGGGVRSSMVSTVTAGKAYAASVMARAAGGDFALGIEYWDEDFTLLGSAEQAIAGEAWGRREVSLTAPAGAAYVSLSVTAEADARGVVYIDEAEIVPVVREIGRDVQLLIDDYILRDLGGATRTFHKAEKTAQGVVTSEHPWEGTAAYIYGTVLYDQQERLYKMWYQIPQSLVGYAVSTDGVNWTKPLNLGAYRYAGSTDNNIIGIAGMLDHPNNGKFHVPTVFKDVNERDAGKRYKMIAFNFNYRPGEDAYCLYTSPDGLVWSSPQPVVSGWDVVTVAYDDRNEQYIGMFKVMLEGKRTHRMAVSKDLVTWTEPVRAFSVATPLDSIGKLRADGYGSGLYARDGVYIGFNWRFLITEGVMSGIVDVPLMFSRDLTEDWQRPFQESIIALGEPGSWDDEMIYTASMPIRVGDELWMYYGGWDGDHGLSARSASIGIARWRLDGFASLDSAGTETVIETRPFLFEGDRLSLNAVVKTGGYIRVEILDGNGSVISGYDECSSAALTGSGVSQTASWGGNADVSSLAGRVVCLRFISKNSELYSFGFTGGTDPVIPAGPEVPDPPKPAASIFEDVPDTHWAAQYINFLVEKKIVNGMEPGLFSPEKTLTREMFVTMLARMSGDDLSGFGTGDLFTDVPKDSFYAPYIEWCAKKGITLGMGDGTFGGGRAITREQIVWMLERYAGQDAVRQAGIYEPLPDGSISRPGDPATRAEMSKMLAIMIKYLLSAGE